MMKEPRPSSRSSAYRGKKRPRDDVITVSKCRCGRAPGTAESLQLAEEQGRGDPNRQSGTGFELGRVVNRGNRPNQRRRVPRVPSPAAAARWGSGTAAPLDVPPGPGLPGVTLAVPAPVRVRTVSKTTARSRGRAGSCSKAEQTTPPSPPNRTPKHRRLLPRSRRGTCALGTRVSWRTHACAGGYLASPRAVPCGR